jgi:RNA polymerase sigma-70 factor (ECF subfamily)
MTSVYYQTLDGSIGQPQVMNSFKDNTADDFAVPASEVDAELVFRNIWERFNLPVKKFICDMCGNYDLTEELTQETFVRVFRGMSKFRGETKFSSWIFGIAKNVVFENWRRARKNDRHVEIEQAASFPVSTEAFSPEYLVLESEMRDAVYKALDRIEPEQRISFVLRVFHGKSLVEIAEITGFGLSKIKVDIYRTRLKLRKWLKPFMEIRNEL